MTGVGDQRHMHLDPVEVAIGAGAEMVFDVARPTNIVGVCTAPRKFVEDHPIGFGHHVREHVEATAVGHAVNDLAHAELATVFDDGFLELITDEESEPNEQRFLALGMSLKGRVLLVVHVCRTEDTVRIISARKATRTETEHYNNDERRIRF